MSGLKNVKKGIETPNFTSFDLKYSSDNENYMNMSLITENFSIKKYLQLKEEVGVVKLCILLPIDSHKLEQMAIIQEQLKTESGLKKSLKEITEMELEMALFQTVKTCDVMEGK